ncbi:hypothetical protein C8R43DRAFT_889774 [Mycena crocata]|nr:hypothetical protein C8R43DRAFT_889774 [Mycena crocata]
MSSSSTSPVAFIIGGGANVGQHVAAALKAKGYQVALGSRHINVEETKKAGLFPVVEGGSPESIKAGFAIVISALGTPSVVVFNATAFEMAPVQEDPLTLSTEAVTTMTGMGVAVFAAAQEFVNAARTAGPEFASESLPRTFIATGNPLPWCPDMRWFGMNIQKVVQWRVVGLLAEAYGREGFRFYYATLVGSTGGIVDNIPNFFTSGAQHAEVYLDLISRKERGEWDYR